MILKKNNILTENNYKKFLNMSSKEFSWKRRLIGQSIILSIPNTQLSLYIQPPTTTSTQCLPRSRSKEFLPTDRRRGHQRMAGRSGVPTSDLANKVSVTLWADASTRASKKSGKHTRVPWILTPLSRFMPTFVVASHPPQASKPPLRLEVG